MPLDRLDNRPPGQPVIGGRFDMPQLTHVGHRHGLP